MISGRDSFVKHAPRLIVIGCSTRAAAFSALRAGYQPICIDQFADADLQAAAEVQRLPNFPEGVLEALERLPDAPVMYTGALENHPEILKKLAGQRRLYGNTEEVVRKVRDPQVLEGALRELRMPALEARETRDPPPADGTWLLKPRASAGGKGIVPWTSETALLGNPPGSHYFQRRAEGLACSAVFIARESIGDVRFVGITELLVGEGRLNAQPFGWCGNVGPITLSVSVESRIRRIANFLKWKFHLRGLFGLDFIVSEDDSLWLTEVNPRYPGSAELLEFATGMPLVAGHCSCFEEGGGEPPPPTWESAAGLILGKAIVYSPARAAVQVKAQFAVDGYAALPRFADVPPPGTVVQRGDPICTVYAVGETVAQCRARLFDSAQAILGTA